MRVLHVVKTADGAAWAAKQAAVLSSLGAEVHVALPRLEGRAMEFWHRSGAILHACNLDLPIGSPVALPAVLKRARRLVTEISPDLIHSHFVGTTLALRLALGRRHPVPRIFQVPGPLHLEHTLYRRLELSTAGDLDFWIGSSRCIVNHYQRAGISPDRVFLSYYGDELPQLDTAERGGLRHRVGAAASDILIGSVSWMYPPKRYLGQRIGLKAHEDLITALGIVSQRDPRVCGVIVGGAWGGAEWYAEKLRRLAVNTAGDRIAFLGALPFAEAKGAWHDLDLAVHVPISENCGGVIEPLLARVPVIASQVGGLPEVIQDHVTGRLVPPRDPQRLAEVILECLVHRDRCQQMALRGQRLVRIMFDVNRTAREVLGIYQHLVQGASRPAEFQWHAPSAHDIRSAAMVPDFDVHEDKETVSCPR